MEQTRQQMEENRFNPAALRDYRKRRRESQCYFWSRFGVTQSRGSRFELGMEIPPPVAILLRLYLGGIITDADLTPARAGENAMGIGKYPNPTQGGAAPCRSP